VGFPKVVVQNLNTVTVNHNSPERLQTGMMAPDGSMLFAPKVAIPAGVALLFNTCYITI